ncbi:ABC transporter permease [Sporolactobacillus shoreicorticis]|uniref:ABC transporter permease n=1 Tax=Sporolactobacillus shoreicorticis TaxID=1923877 RepID=A0ABW5S320_9BACL|nr:ABC transporter permease [Sporolactobacillus shoreicorticis]MCO7127074.1 ABC transporter permease [Sporolactobacillus shoreicorticis]
MLIYTFRRLAEMILTLFIIATATFFLLAAVPGDPISDRVEKLPTQIRHNMYAKYGLNKPLLQRYVITMKGLAVGNFGESIIYPGQTVQSILHDKLPASARLGIQQMVLGITIGLGLGIIAAMKKNTWIDYSIITAAILLISIPHLIFGLLLQKMFAGNLGWFPVIGWPKGKDLWTGGWEYTILPTLTGCFAYIASYTRLLKTSMLDVVNQDYILTAESKGISKARVVLKHVLRNSMIPIITNLPMSIAMCITGSFFIERIFSIPGIGMYYVTSVNGRDLPLIMGQTVIISAIYVTVIFITDVLYTIVDPRIQIQGGRK